jgi:hypothetical protein
VDENHSAVIALVSLGYGKEQSIDAIAKYGTLEKAMDHMADTSDEEDGEDEEEDEEEPDPVLSNQLSREDSVPSIEMYR